MPSLSSGQPALPPPSPTPINSNLELRGFFKYAGAWHFAIFDKVKNKGFWLKKGESFDNGKVQIESFNPETSVVKMKGGQTLTLKASEHKVMPVPSAQPVKKTNPTPPKNLQSVYLLPVICHALSSAAKTIGCSSLIYFLDSMIAEDKEVSEEKVESKSHLPELELHLERSHGLVA